MTPRLTIIFTAFLAALVGCQPVSNNPDDVACVNEVCLTWAQLQEVIPDNSSSEDSALLANNYIQNWIKEEVILSYALNNLNEEQMNFDLQIENYRKSLLTFALENQIVTQHLDTAININELEAYYNENLDNFQLKDYILKAKFCILDSAQEVGKPFEKLFYSDDPQDLVSFESFCVDNGINYFIDEDQWLYFGDLIQEVPLQVYKVERFLKKNKRLTFTEDGRRYFLQIVDYKLKDSVSPLSLQKEKIRNIILNRRKLDLLSKMRDDLYKEAVRKNRIQTHYE